MNVRPTVRRVLTAAGLAVGVLAVAAPALAAAGTGAGTPLVEVSGSTGEVSFDARDSAHPNRVEVWVEGTRAIVHDANNPLSAGSGCKLLDPNTARCGSDVTRLRVVLGPGDDFLVLRSPLTGSADGGAGNDKLTAAVTGPSTSRMAYSGGPDQDTISYDGADSGVFVTLDGDDRDGRRWRDHDNVADDIEKVMGSRSADVLTGNDLPNMFDGLGGGDEILGLGGADVFDAGDATSRFDRYVGGEGFDKLTYSARTVPTAVYTVDAGLGRYSGDTDHFLEIEWLILGSGADQVDAFGAGVRHVNCGAGADVIRAPRAGGTHVNCETVLPPLNG
jgi:hypothetical protein